MSSRRQPPRPPQRRTVQHVRDLGVAHFGQWIRITGLHAPGHDFSATADVQVEGVLVGIRRVSDRHVRLTLTSAAGDTSTLDSPLPINHPAFLVEEDHVGLHLVPDLTEGTTP